MPNVGCEGSESTYVAQAAALPERAGRGNTIIDEPLMHRSEVVPVVCAEIPLG
jgi:hypothetical protein